MESKLAPSRLVLARWTAVEKALELFSELHLSFLSPLAVVLVTKMTSAPDWEPFPWGTASALLALALALQAPPPYALVAASERVLAPLQPSRSLL